MSFVRQYGSHPNEITDQIISQVLGLENYIKLFCQRM